MSGYNTESMTVDTSVLASHGLRSASGFCQLRPL